jgi:hypothetical protein
MEDPLLLGLVVEQVALAAKILAGFPIAGIAMV